MRRLCPHSAGGRENGIPGPLRRARPGAWHSSGDPAFPGLSAAPRVRDYRTPSAGTSHPSAGPAPPERPRARRAGRGAALAHARRGRPLTPLSYAKYVRGGAGAGRARRRRHGAVGAGAAGGAAAALGGCALPRAAGQRPLSAVGREAAPGMADPLRRTLSKLRGRRSQRGAAAGAGHRHGGVCASQGKCAPGSAERLRQPALGRSSTCRAAPGGGSRCAGMLRARCP